MRLDLRANLAQFSLLVAVNALVGGTLGQEHTRAGMVRVWGSGCWGTGAAPR